MRFAFGSLGTPLVAAVLVAAASPAAARDDSRVGRGSALFNGQADLRGRLADHVDPLPAAVLACVNCHEGRAADGAPDLRGGWLSTTRSRRNGPASAYDAATFCATLRTGIDPVQVRLPVLMPRFDLSDEACSDLWNYLDAPRPRR